jgi:hypothetical protein
MHEPTNNHTDAQHAGPDLPTLLQPGGRLEAMLNSTRNTARQSQSSARLHERLTRDLESLRLEWGMPSSEPPAGVVVLHLCIAAAGKDDIPKHLWDDAMREYAQHPSDYDSVLGDLIPEDFRRQAQDRVAQQAYFENRNCTAAEDWGFFEHMCHEDASVGLPGLHTGLSRVDERIDGLRGLTFIGGDKGDGKTSLGLQIVLSAMNSDPHLGAVVYSLDMAKSRIYERLLCLEAGVTYRSFRDPSKSADVQQRIARAHERIRDSIAPRLRVVERSFDYERNQYPEDAKAYRKGLRAGDVIGDCNRLLGLGNVHRIVLVFDLFQKIIPFGDVADGAATDHYRLDMLSEVMKKTAGPDQPRGFPILVTSEIRKETHKGTLTMNDLKGDGRMASDADVVMLMWPDPNSAQGDSDVVPTILRIDKGREGVVRGDVKLWFEHPCFRFHDTEPEAANSNLDHKNKITSSAGNAGSRDDPLGE